MPKNLTISVQDGYLLTEFFGKFSVEDGKQCIDAMIKASLESRRPKVLLDCRKMTGDMPITARFEVAVYSVTTLGVISKIALVSRPDIVLPDGFVENAAVNRGVNLRIFVDFDEAVRWLLE